MTETGQAPAALTAQLLVDFCVPVAQGNARPGPGAPVMLDDAQRRSLGLATSGDTYAYPAQGSTVFLDLNAQRLQIWFVHPHAVNALDAVQRALTRAFPAMRQVDEKEGQEPGRRDRFLLGEFGADQAVQVEISYPAAGANASNAFFVRVMSMHIADRANFRKLLSRAG
ncbi:MAG: hypothetical protein K2P58_05145 [Hyphomonadaceae bacterium]|nr:hypothetical protein [Hyphomonadaceae bacterium]